MAKYLLSFGLQLFAEGGGGAAGGDAGGAPGVTAAAAGQQGVNAQTAHAQTDGADAEYDADAAFEELIKGEYREQYNKRVQDTVQKRLKGTKETVDKYNAVLPLLDTIAMKYGVDAADIAALTKAVDEDESYWEEAAFEKGITVEQLKETTKLKRENEILRRQEAERAQQQQIDADLARWMHEAKNVKQTFPGFDFQAELNDPVNGPQFLGLLKSGISMEAAYFAIHNRELVPQAMQFAANQAQQQTVAAIRAGAGRPTENGNRGNAAATTRIDVSKLTREQRAEYIRRAQAGERITFT